MNMDETISSIHLDYGNEFQQEVIQQPIKTSDGEFQVSYQFEGAESFQEMKWQPAEKACMCMISEVKSNKGIMSARAFNKAYSDAGYDVFLTLKPSYILEGNMEGITEISISGRMELLSLEELTRKAEQAVAELDHAYSTELRQLQQYIIWIQGSRLWIFYRGKEWLKSKLRFLKQKYQGLKRRVKGKIERHEEAKASNLLEIFSQNIISAEAELETDETIDVIVPIYNGYDYLVRLFPTIERTNMKHRVFLVDDCSPDPRVHEIERQYAEAHENAVLLNNPENYGFVKSVNNALAKSQNHVALVNTDTELPDLWLERLMKPILTGEKVASATPYSNSATIFSFPNFCYNNEIYRGLTVDEIDSVFARIKPKYVKAPTGVGFCMGMNKHALKQVGNLDFETFSKGFGEENDWCQRAERAGYQNVQVENLFVYHKHGGSFLSEEKAKLLEHNVAIISKRYPNYDRDVSAFIRRDENMDIRHIVQILLDMQMPGQKSILAFDHLLGGGATSYLNQKVKLHTEQGDAFSVVRYDLGHNVYRFLFQGPSFKKEYVLSNFGELLELSKYLHFDEIYVNELVTYPFLAQTLENIVRLAESCNAKLVMLFHDYFAICPSINLVGPQNTYCRFPDKEACLNCFRQKQCHNIYQYNNVDEWQAVWKSFLQKCTEVRTFSEDTLARVKQVYGEELSLTLVPHKVEYLFPIHKEYKTEKIFTIGLLGIMSLHKGREIVKNMLDVIDQRQLDARIVLIGECEDNSLLKYKRFSQTGRYQAEKLVELIYQNDIDIFVIPSIWPETFSYTAEEIMQMGMPVASFDIGAPAMRIRQYEKGMIVPDMTGAALVDAVTGYFNRNKFRERVRHEEQIVVFVAEYISFSSRYRVEHMREELLAQGVKSEFWNTEHLPKQIAWSKIRRMVIYRCRFQGPIRGLIQEAKAHHVELIYDIDDYLFEYSQIADLPFMRGEEYRDFDVYCAKIRECMEVCDKFTTSTNVLKEAILRSFPDKPVFVNRNKASAEMMILSAKARLEKSQRRNNITLGYFSGSRTHNRDFEIISETLLKILDERPNVLLKIVGCLELPKEYDRFSSRIEFVGFMDWEKLPEVIASVDINLMPLENTFFHACKSENKWMEAALVEVATVASYNQEMSQNTSDGEDIFLCRSNKEWHEKLLCLIDDGECREKIARKAWQRVMAEKGTLTDTDAVYRFVME